MVKSYDIFILDRSDRKKKKKELINIVSNGEI